MEKMIKNFAIIQKGCGLYGVGEDIPSAVEDTKQWLDLKSYEDLKKDLLKNELRFYPLGDHGEMVWTDDPDTIKEYLETI